MSRAARSPCAPCIAIAIAAGIAACDASPPAGTGSAPEQAASQAPAPAQPTPGPPAASSPSSSQRPADGASPTDAGRAVAEAAKETTREAARTTRDLARDAGQLAREAGGVALRAIDDATVTARVRMVLAALKGVSSADISVTTEQGRVTLDGRVADAAQAARLGELVAQIEGVDSVENRLAPR